MQCERCFSQLQDPQEEDFWYEAKKIWPMLQVECSECIENDKVLK